MTEIVYIRTETPPDHPDGRLLTKTEVPPLMWDTERETTLNAVRRGVAWYLERKGTSATGPTKYLVARVDPDPFRGAPPQEIERGPL